MSQEKIAITKLGRAGKLVNTGAKVGANYVKHYAKSIVQKSSKKELEEENAKDIYKAFSELKGGPLKIAQMLSMGEQVLPQAYIQQFSKAQNQVDPLSYPLVRKIIKKAFGQLPENLFQEFSRSAVNAASIGQVHQAKIDGKLFAVKIQYPGVAESLQSDIRMITPVATRILGVKKQDIAPYLNEVERKLMQETDYVQEFSNARRIIEGANHLEGLVFPEFRKEFSNDRVITMSWIEGLSLTDWIANNPNQEMRNQIGQRLWDFYQYQIHQLKFIHADPHPGNFIITADGKLGVIDFGCVKSLPDDFYTSYLQLLQSGADNIRSADFESALSDLNMLYDSDSPEERKYILKLFSEMFQLVGQPLFQDSFDFSDSEYFKKIYTQGENLSKDKELRGLSTRGSHHFIYFNRTYFGLYQLLHQLSARVKSGGLQNHLKKIA